jgi:rhamnogalacturonyl hydrolase YesR
MAPPLLAYKGVVSADLSLLKESVLQCELYHEVLSMGPEKGYWKHIDNVHDVAGGKQVKKDDGAWCTSNAWAAAGMARVIATMMGSRRFATETKKEQADLGTMVQEILDSAMRADTHPSGLLRNYLDDESWFGEVGLPDVRTACETYTDSIHPHSGCRYCFDGCCGFSHECAASEYVRE